MMKQQSLKKANEKVHVGSWGRLHYWQLAGTALLAVGLFMLLCWIRGLFPAGDGSILMIDLHSQYTPLLYRFYDVVTGSKNLFMDFHVSGGANLYADTINEVINPFNYLLLFFGRERIYLAINLLLGAYLAAAAVSANIFLLRIWPDRRRWNVVFSLVYGFSGFAAYQFQIIKWMIFPVIFPFFVLALRRLLREKKGGWYAVLLAYQLMLNLQLGAMTLLVTLFGSGLYFFFGVTGISGDDQVKIGDCSDLRKKEKRQSMCRLVLYTVAGVAMSAVVLLPGVVYLLHSARGGQNGSYFAVMKQHGLDDLFERLFLTVHPVLLGMFLVSICKAVKNRIKGKAHYRRRTAEEKFLIALNILLLLTVLAQPSNLLWHLGSYMCFPVRYAYMVLLAGICLLKWKQSDQDMQAGEEEQNQILRAWQLGCECLAVVLSIAALYLAMQESDQISQAFSTLAISRVCPAQTALVCMIMGILTVAAVFAHLAGKRRQFTMTVVTCASGLCLFLFILLPQNYPVRLMNEDAYKTMNDMHQNLTVEQVENNALERVPDDEDMPLNAALITGDSTLTGYFPAGSQQVYAKGLEQLGYLTPWVSTRSWGGTMISDGMLGLGKTETALVFGDALLLEEDVHKLEDETRKAAADGPLALQAYLGQAIAGTEVLTVMDASEIFDVQTAGLCADITGQQAVYLDAGYSASEIQIWANGKEIAIPEGNASEGKHRLVYLGCYTDEKILIQVLDKGGAAIAAEPDMMKLGILDLEAWCAAAETVGKKDIQFNHRSGSMKADVAGADAQTLFVPVAAIDGWHCTADGEKMDITPIFGGFMGITLPESARMLEFTFYPAGLNVGIICSILGILLTVICQFVQWRMSAKAGCFVFESIAAVGYRAVWMIGFLLIYVIPNVGMVCYMIWRIIMR